METNIQTFTLAIRMNNIRPSVFLTKQPRLWQKIFPLRSNVAEHQEWWGWDQEDMRGGGIRSAWTVPSRSSSAGMRAGQGDFQGVETSRPLINVQKGAQEKTTTTRRHQNKGRQRSGWIGNTTEDDSRPGLEVQPPRYWKGMGPQVEAERGGGMVREMAEEGRNIEGRNHRGWQGR